MSHSYPLRFQRLFLLVSTVVIILGCGGSGSSGTGSTTTGSSGSTGSTGTTGTSTTGTSTTGTSTTGTSTTGSSTTGTTTGGAGVPDLGAGADMHGFIPFPADNAWNTPIDTAPVDPNSANLIASIGPTTGLHPDFGANYNGGPFGIPYVVVAGTQATVPMSFTYSSESDPGPYPIPANAPIEGGAASSGDRHVLVIDRDHKQLYETWSSYPQNNGASWMCGSGAKFDLTSDNLRPAGWTSADAAGLPIFPGLVRYDEVWTLGAIKHALRFTVQKTREGYISPARHYASSNTSANLPPMGMRVRLKAGFDVSSFSPHNQVILNCLKKYGMIVADNGSNWYISGAPDARWDDNDLNALKTVQGSNFEVVQMGTVTGP